MTLKELDALEHRIGDVALWVILALAALITVLALVD